MPNLLWLGPAASGKTQACVERVRQLARSAPLTPIWVLLPDGHQIKAFRRRLMAAGGAFGVRVGTFDELYAEALAQVDAPLPVASEPVVHRLIQTVLDQLADEGALQHYGPIRRRPGLALALNDLFAELKRSRVTPEALLKAVAESEPRLRELAAAYARYQATLIRVGWADVEGRGWLAIEALERDATLCRGWHIVVDGFDSFTATQRDTLRVLTPRLASLVVTLMGEGDLSRTAHRRFRSTLAALRDSRLDLSVEALPARQARPLALRRLAESLFVSGVAPTVVDGPRPAIAFLEAQTPALEAREALRWLKARHLRDGVPLETCAVIARDLGAYEPFLRESAQEFGLPLALTAGSALEHNPAIAAFLNALQLPLTEWARRPVLDLVRSPYADLSGFGLAHRDAARLDAVSRAGQVIAGLVQWREAFDILAAMESSTAEDLDDEDAPPALPRGSAARSLGDGLLGLLSRLAPPPRGSLRSFVVWAEDLIDTVRLETALAHFPETEDRDRAALAALREVFAALILSDEVFGQEQGLTYAEFHAELRGAVAAARYRAEPRVLDEAILATELRRARGVPFAAVAVLGLAEGLFPAPLTEDPFLSDDERLAFQEQGLNLEQRLRSDQQSLFYEAVTRADRFLLLTRPYLAEDGEAWQPSPFWQATRALFGAPVARVRQGDPRASVDAASLIEALEAGGGAASVAAHVPTLTHQRAVLAARLSTEARGPHEGDLAAWAAQLERRFGPGHTWSPSRLETYGACGFRFLIGPALGLEPRDPPRLGLDVAQLGTLLHEILERVYQAAGTDELEALVAALPDVAAPIFAAAPRKLGFRPTSLWARQQAELLEWLAGSLRGLAEIAEGFTPIAFEQRFSRLTLDTAAGPVRVRGIIDRVDRNAAGELRVIDYKTGAGHLDPQSLLDGVRLQLPLYAAAAAQELTLGQPVDGLYFALRKGEAGRLRLADFEGVDPAGQVRQGVSGAIALAAEHIGVSIAGIRAGRFQPAPPATGCPEYCPAAAFCWRYRPGR
ncbi:MAG: exodeoxyribonuclease V subunit gamma [Anaerolineales bacterium]|nr:exodeoxyribonuclease V subunit gamma [Anaerolineales bacterium]